MLRDYYEIIEYDLKPRPVVMENIEKVINCGDPSYGGAMYICTHCKNWKFVPFRCHSRFSTILSYSSRKSHCPVSVVNSSPTIPQSIRDVLPTNYYSYQDLRFLFD